MLLTHANQLQVVLNTAHANRALQSCATVCTHAWCYIDHASKDQSSSIRAIATQVGVSVNNKISHCAYTGTANRQAFDGRCHPQLHNYGHSKRTLVARSPGSRKGLTPSTISAWRSLTESLRDARTLALIVHLHQPTGFEGSVTAR